MLKIYFGHPMNTYGTPLETRLLAEIGSAFPRLCIENPNQPRHQEGCRRWEAETGNPMGYFFEEVLPSCHAGIFLPFRDGMWGHGVFGEAVVLLEQESRIWEISPSGIITPIDVLDGSRELSIDETLARIKTASGEWAPY
ncbi:MAG: hypothetical protein WCF77_03730 [Minisyncoccia bacterium]